MMEPQRDAENVRALKCLLKPAMCLRLAALQPPVFSSLQGAGRAVAVLEMSIPSTEPGLHLEFRKTDMARVTNFFVSESPKPSMKGSLWEQMSHPMPQGFSSPFPVDTAGKRCFT